MSQCFFIRSWVAGLAAAMSVVACGSDSVSGLEIKNLNRPVDVAFACYGNLRLSGGDGPQVSDPVVTSPMGLAACETYAADAIPSGQEALDGAPALAKPNWFGFIAQSSLGTVAIATFPARPASLISQTESIIVDADRLTPGKNGIAVGTLPAGVATDPSGCYVMTANAGSCDLSVIDVASALAFDGSAKVTQLGIRAGDGTPISAKPSAILSVPGTFADVACPSSPTGPFVVALPGCGAVAFVDGGGNVTNHIRFDAHGQATLGGAELTCPAECDGEVSADRARPYSLDLRVDDRVASKRLAIGNETDGVVTVVDLDDAYQPASLLQVSLSGGVRVTDVALSPQIGMGGSSFELNDDASAGPQMQFVYAVASDGSVRVAEVLDVHRECDTQIDPRSLKAQNDLGVLGCLPIGNSSMPRRAGARGPGIRLVGATVPTSVAFFSANRTGVPPTGGAQPGILVGHFAAVTGANGNLYFVNVDDDAYKDTDSGAPMDVHLPLALAHQLRDRVPARDALAEDTVDGVTRPVCDDPGPAVVSGETSGGPRAPKRPTYLIDLERVSPENVTALPTLASVMCVDADGETPVGELGFSAPALIRDRAFPDLRALNFDESWTFTWEGALSVDSIDSDTDGPQVRRGAVFVDGTGMRLEDPAHPYCAAGVEVGDSVTLVGCDASLGDAQCPVGTVCYVHPDAATATGVCLPRDQTAVLAGPCRQFLVSDRRFSVASPHGDRLTLVERPYVLETTPVQGCESTAQCVALADAQVRLASSEDPVLQTDGAEERAWVCQPDPSRATPVNRCMIGCAQDEDCLEGNVCGARGVCVEGVVPPLQCIAGPQRYVLRASDAFVVLGSVTGYLHNLVESLDGTCVPDAMASPLLVGRVPLSAPACTDVASPNPCQTQFEHAEAAPSYVAGSCEVSDPATVTGRRLTDAIRFSNPAFTMHLVDPTYPGDAQCFRDRQGTLPGMRTVYPGVSFQFDVLGGFQSFRVPLPSALPRHIVNGPQQSLWVIDEGEVTTTTADLRGQVFRIDTPSLQVTSFQ